MLLILGLNPESADMFWMLDSKDYYEPVCIPYSESGADKDDGIPCWSVAALLELMPKQIIYEEESCSPILLSYKNDWYACIYVNKYMEFAFDPIGDRETAIEACYEMVCWLLENKYI